MCVTLKEPPPPPFCHRRAASRITLMEVGGYGNEVDRPAERNLPPGIRV